ncbi:MAG: hypothetical protein C4530_01650, partial [Desulfobacteraceae bacterium]
VRGRIDPLISFDGPPEYQNRQRPFKDRSGSYDAVCAKVQKLRSVFPGLLVGPRSGAMTTPSGSRRGWRKILDSSIFMPY